MEELVKVDRSRGRGRVINNIKQLSDGLAVVNTVWQFLKKLNIELPHDPAVPFLSVYPNELKTVLKYMHAHAQNGTIHNSKRGKQRKYPTKD